MIFMIKSKVKLLSALNNINRHNDGLVFMGLIIQKILFNKTENSLCKDYRYKPNKGFTIF